MRAGDPQRCALGHLLVGNAVGAATQFGPGNWEALQHTQRSDRWPPELQVLRAEVEAFETAALVDEGDEAELPARRRALLGYRARLHRRILQLDGLLELRGLADKRGKLRVAWLQQLAGLIEKARQLDVTLGLERRAKRVPSLSEYLAQRNSRAARAPSLASGEGEPL